MPVTVYSTPSCPYCRQVKAYLREKGVSFRDYDVSQNREAAAEMVRLSGQRGVPVVAVDGKVVVGFDRPRLDALLERAARPRLGAAVADAKEQARKGRCSVSQGAYIGRVDTQGVVARAGLRVGDVITSYANRSVSDADDLQRLLARTPQGEAIPVTYVRGDVRRQTQITF